MKVYYSINEFDSEGQVSEFGVFLHFGETRIRVAEDDEGFAAFSEDVKTTLSQIQHRLKQYNELP